MSPNFSMALFILGSPVFLRGSHWITLGIWQGLLLPCPARTRKFTKEDFGKRSKDEARRSVSQLVPSVMMTQNKKITQLVPLDGI